MGGDLEDMQRTAEDPSNDFMGAAFFQFQTAHFKGGSELNFGLFQLGSETLWEISPPCDIEAQLQPFKCPTPWPVHCLQADLTFLSGTMGHRAAAVAAAWHGSMARVESGPGFCKGTRRLSNDGTRIACQILRVKGGEAYVSRQLQGSDFSKQLGGDPWRLASREHTDCNSRGRCGRRWRQVFWAWLEGVASANPCGCPSLGGLRARILGLPFKEDEEGTPVWTHRICGECVKRPSRPFGCHCSFGFSDTAFKLADV